MRLGFIPQGAPSPAFNFPPDNMPSPARLPPFVPQHASWFRRRQLMKARVKLHTKRLYAADGYAVKELLKVASLLYDAIRKSAAAGEDDDDPAAAAAAAGVKARERAPLLRDLICMLRGGGRLIVSQCVVMGLRGVEASGAFDCSSPCVGNR